VRDAIAWRLGRRQLVRMKPLPTTAVVFAGYGTKREERRGREGARTVGG
jgi:2-polyprenyl-6-hydroxyphenyl methylase/3-demethylubiquinone-9 3-methyltransferase